MTHFSKKIDLRSRKEMIDYLVNHFRYDTMNSWNCSTSYANNVKLHKLPIPDELYDMAYKLAMSGASDNPFLDIVNLSFCDFRDKWGYSLGFNGNNDGYIVLYESFKEDGIWKTYPGHSIDQGEDFEDWDIYSIRERVKLVQAFDEVCDQLLEKLITLAKEYTIEEVEEEIVVINNKFVRREH